MLQEQEHLHLNMASSHRQSLGTLQSHLLYNSQMVKSRCRSSLLAEGLRVLPLG